MRDFKEATQFFPRNPMIRWEKKQTQLQLQIHVFVHLPGGFEAFALHFFDQKPRVARGVALCQSAGGADTQTPDRSTKVLVVEVVVRIAGRSRWIAKWCLARLFRMLMMTLEVNLNPSKHGGS